MSKFKFNDTDEELLSRFVKQPENLVSGIEWITGGLTRVLPETAVQLARGGRPVFCVDDDGTDYRYEAGDPIAVDTTTIFVVEGKL